MVHGCRGFIIGPWLCWWQWLHASPGRDHWHCVHIAQPTFINNTATVTQCLCHAAARSHVTGCRQHHPAPLPPPLMAHMQAYPKGHNTSNVTWQIPCTTASQGPTSCSSLVSQTCRHFGVQNSTKRPTNTYLLDRINLSFCPWPALPLQQTVHHVTSICQPCDTEGVGS